MSIALPRPRVLNGAFTICSPEWSWSTVYPPLGWEGYLLWVTLAGRAEVDSRGGTLLAEPGQALLLHLAEEDYEGWTVEPEDMALQWVHFTLPDAPGRVLPRCVRLGDMDFVEQALGRVIRRIKPDGQRSPLADAWLGALLAEWTASAPPERPTRARQSRCRSALEQLCHEIEQRPGYDWSVEEMAGRVGISRAQLNRLFRRHRGCTPHGFVIRTRIGQAARQLRLSNASLGEIAEHLGYCDAFALSRQFKQVTGQTPTAYRRGESG